MNEMKATTSMPARRGLVCVECGAPVPLLVRDYGKGSIRLAICGVCNQVADKYVEYETVLLFLEVLLLKPQVYRHVLYNLPAPMETRTLVKLCVILVMLDMNVKAYLVDRKAGVSFRSESMYADTDRISGLRISQFSLHLVGLSMLENAVYFGAVFALVCCDPFRRNWRATLLRDRSRTESDVDAVAFDSDRIAPTATIRSLVLPYVSAMIVSSFGKLFALLTVIWEYNWTFIHVIGGIVFFSNVLALQLLLGEGDPAQAKSWRVAAVVLAGLLARFASQLALYALGNSVLFYVFV